MICKGVPSSVWFLLPTLRVTEIINTCTYSPVAGPTPQPPQKNPKKPTNSLQCFFTDHYVQDVLNPNLNDITLASLGNWKYPRWWPSWLPKCKYGNIFASGEVGIMMKVSFYRILGAKE